MGHSKGLGGVEWFSTVARGESGVGGGGPDKGSEESRGRERKQREGGTPVGPAGDTGLMIL